MMERYTIESVKPKKDVRGSVRHEEEVFKLVLLHEIQKVILHAPPPFLIYLVFLVHEIRVGYGDIGNVLVSYLCGLKKRT